MACWFWSSSLTTDQTLMGIARPTGFERSVRLIAGGNRASDPLVARTYNGSASELLSSNTYVDNAWQHAAMSAIVGNTGTVWLNGTKTAGSITVNDGNATSLMIGGAWVSEVLTTFLDGGVAWPAIWQAELTDEEFVALSQGAHPLTIRPEHLVVFYDFEGREREYTRQIRQHGEFPLVNNGSQIAPAPGWLRTRVGEFPIAPAAEGGGGGLAIPIAAYHYNHHLGSMAG